MKEIKEWKCIKCETLKTEGEFRKNFIQRSDYVCKVCDNKRRSKGRIIKPIIIIENNKEKYFCTFCKDYHLKEDMYITEKGLKRRDLRCKSCSQTRSKKYRTNNMEKVLLANAKVRALKNNLDFNIEIEDILIPKICPLLEIPIVIGNSISERDSSPSLDRIDNTKGYVKGNIRVISNLANSIKRDLSRDQLQTFIKNIIDYMT